MRLLIAWGQTLNGHWLAPCLSNFWCKGDFDMLSYELGARLVLLSLEPWDDVWRRNQHLVWAMVSDELVQSIVFVEPPSANGPRKFSVGKGVQVVAPPLAVKPRYGGYWTASRWLRRHVLVEGDRIWVNNAPMGRWFLDLAICYDITDDWRESAQGPATRRRQVRAEDLLARRCATIACSEVLRERWQERYGVRAHLVPNGVDSLAYKHAQPVSLSGPAPHLTYVGTLHEERVDIALVEAVSKACTGTLHLVGPNHLSPSAHRRLEALGNVALTGPVPAQQVPGWLIASDALLVPHVVSPFTMSLDAIKAYEYLSTDRPVVATPTSGFQQVQSPGLTVAIGADFVRAAVSATGSFSRPAQPSWRERAQELILALQPVRGTTTS